MSRVLIAGALGFGLAVLTACSVTPPTQAALNVRVISEEQAKQCRFVDSVSTHNNNTLSSSPQTEARNKALNAVADKGGNALRIISTNTQASDSGVGSIFHLTGEAYACN